MSMHDMNNPHRTRIGSAGKAGPSGRNIQQTTDSPGTRIGANRPTTSTVIQPLITEHPRMKQRVRKAGDSPAYKTFRVTHLNCANSRDALEELTLIRHRDDILLTSETPLVDNIPPEIQGYTKIHTEYDPENDTKPCVCAYIRDTSLEYTTHHQCSDTETAMRIEGRLLRGIYSPPNKTPPHVYDAMSDEEIRMGDYNAAHPRWKDDDTRTTSGGRLARWMDDEGAEERGPREATHIKGNKLDLIFTKDRNSSTTIHHNGRVEHSDHQCQSISFKVTRQIRTDNYKTDYRKTNAKTIEEWIRSKKYPEPKDPSELTRQLEDIRTNLPKKQVRDRTRIPLIVLDKRRTLNRAMRSKKIGRQEIRELRIDYRESIRKYGNERITQEIDQSQDNDRFFELSKRGTTKKAIPPMMDEDGRRYATHAEISERLANHHGQGDPVPEDPKTTDDIEPITHGEVKDAIDKAPANSTIGTDDVGIPLLKAYHRAKPSTLGRIFTDILREGRHYSEWKKATVVPIPKANKPRYDHPKKGGTDIDGRYGEWIYNWTQNRKINFRFNGQTDGRMFTTNRGLPQGSPLSPYLFGGYVKQIVTEDTRFLKNVFIISYVDDILICIRGKDQKEMEDIGRAAWQRINERAGERGMSFAENKTKTWTNTGTWTIGTRIKELRFLGYWYTAGTTSTEKHTKHWLTKANYAYNQLRALTQRYETGKGLNTLSTIRILHSTARTIGLHGIEHSNEEDCKHIDSFMYETVKRLFDMPINTPHRAISAEFALTPTRIQREYIIARIRQRHTTFPDIMRKARDLGGLAGPRQEEDETEPGGGSTLPWQVEVPDPVPDTPITTLPRDHPIHVGHLLTKIGSTGSITYTDGSARTGQNAAYGLVQLDYRGQVVYQDNGKLASGKSILDAETTAIYKAMEHILLNGHPSPIVSTHFILTDSAAALHAVTNPARKGTLAYLNAWREEIETHPMRQTTQFLIGKVKAHSGITGNEMADKLAKSATTYKDPYPGTSMSKLSTDISNARQKNWETWYNLEQHEYQGKPTRRLKRHRNLSRIDSTTLFRLKTNKGWNTSDHIGTAPPANCETCTTPKDAHHAMKCPDYSSKRPLDITTAINRQIPRADVMDWIRSHNHFGFENKMYEVAFIRLKIGKYRLNRNTGCEHCDYITSNPSNLKKHVLNVHSSTPKQTNRLTAAEKTCPYCSETFNRKDRRNAHVRRHEKEIAQPATPRSLQQAARSQYKRDEKTLAERTCTQCDFVATTLKSKKAHDKEHEVEKHKGMIRCHGCSQYFPNRKDLREHQRSNCGGSRS